MDFFRGRHTTFEFLQEQFYSSELPQFGIKFHFFFKSQKKHYIQNQDQPLRCLLHSIPSYNGITSAAVAATESPPLEHIAEAVRKAVGDRLLVRECGELIELVHEQVSRSFTTETRAKHGVLHLCFEVRVEHRHVYVFLEEGGGGPRMVPAGDTAFALLEEYEVGRARADVEEEEESCCCICLEELGGGGALRMPCTHVFHAGCIKGWLRKSHYCPICRYEMPTE